MNNFRNLFWRFLHLQYMKSNSKTIKNRNDEKGALNLSKDDRDGCNNFLTYATYASLVLISLSICTRKGKDYFVSPLAGAKVLWMRVQLWKRFHVKFNQFTHQFHCQERLLVFDFVLVWARLMIDTIRVHSILVPIADFIVDKWRASLRLLWPLWRPVYWTPLLLLISHRSFPFSMSQCLFLMRSADPISIPIIDKCIFVIFRHRSPKPKAHRLPHPTVWAFVRSQLLTTHRTYTKCSKNCWSNHERVRWSRESSQLAKWLVRIQLNMRIKDEILLICFHFWSIRNANWQQRHTTAINQPRNRASL